MGAITLEYRWLLPAALTVEPDAGRPVRRTTRDWIVDTVCFALGLGFTVLSTADLLGGDPAIVSGWDGTPRWLLWVDFSAGLLAAVALWWRRRWPVQIMLASLPIGLFSVSAAITCLILLFTVAVHRRFAVTATVAALSLGVNAVFVAIRPDNDTSYWEATAWSAVFLLVVVLWGMVVRARRQLVVSLRDRAVRAESEQQLRVTQARVLERTRIAREMHDVLAHRISLLSLHAGALEIRPDAPAAEVARAAGVIRASARQALQDLRQVIGVLRDASEPGSPERPQPTLDDLPALAQESQAAGQRVRLDVHVDRPETVPAGTGRTAYRIVQEGLTNARKHAPGTAVTVRVDGSAADGLTIEVRNPVPIGRSGPSLAHPGPSPGSPRPFPCLPRPSPALPGPSPALPAGPSPALPAGPSPALPATSPTLPGSFVAPPGAFLGFTGAFVPLPGAGSGLIGLAERAALAGGRLGHGESGGDFTLTAWLPWPT